MSNVGYAANFVQFSNCSPEPIGLASVSIEATIPTASEQGRVRGQFRVTRTGRTSKPLTVYYGTVGTATSGKDYARLTGRVTIPVNSSSAVFWVMPMDDRVHEGEETVVVALLGSPGYDLGGTATALVTIQDNDPPPPVVSITAGDSAASEAPGDPGQFTISRSVVTTRPLTVRYAVSGTANGGVDYTRLYGRVTIPAGQASVTINLVPREDTAVEGSEIVTLTLLNDLNYGVDGANGSATVTIADND
jgi:hypothetical protein